MCQIFSNKSLQTVYFWYFNNDQITSLIWYFFQNEQELQMRMNSKWLIIILLAAIVCLFYFSHHYKRLTLRKREALHDYFHDGLSSLKSACRQDEIRSLDQSDVPLYMFNYDPSSGLLMCHTAKHGSTTWSGYFVTIFQNGWGRV